MLNLQVKGAEKILYGLDDIKDADEMIIVIYSMTIWCYIIYDGLLYHLYLIATLVLLSFWSQVEGEMDKLSMEQAGVTNCVSVPGGAPQRVSTKELPSLDKVYAGPKIRYELVAFSIQDSFPLVFGKFAI